MTYCKNWFSTLFLKDVRSTSFVYYLVGWFMWQLHAMMERLWANCSWLENNVLDAQTPRTLFSEQNFTPQLRQEWEDQRWQISEYMHSRANSSLCLSSIQASLTPTLLLFLVATISLWSMYKLFSNQGLFILIFVSILQ